MATGTVEQGVVKVNDEVELIGIFRKPQRTTITGLEMFRKTLDQAVAGDNIGALLRTLEKKDVTRGMCLVKPGSFQVFRNFEGTVYILKESEGGRHKPFTTGYSPQCFLKTADVAAVMDIGEGKMAMPGDNLSGKFKLQFPLPIQVGDRFALREGGKTVAAGVITNIPGDS